MEIGYQTGDIRGLLGLLESFSLALENVAGIFQYADEDGAFSLHEIFTEIGKGIPHEPGWEVFCDQPTLLHIKQILYNVGNARSRRGIGQENSIVFAAQDYLVAMNIFQIALEF